jgi:hypothetical protein
LIPFSIKIPQDEATVFKRFYKQISATCGVKKKKKQDGRHGNAPKRFLVRN